MDESQVDAVTKIRHSLWSSVIRFLSERSINRFFIEWLSIAQFGAFLNVKKPHTDDEALLIKVK